MEKCIFDDKFEKYIFLDDKFEKYIFSDVKYTKHIFSDDKYIKMVTPVKRVPIHLQSAQNRLIIKNGTLVNHDGEEEVDIYIEVSIPRYRRSKVI